jgi:multiple sugar transport system permease protein
MFRERWIPFAFLAPALLGLLMFRLFPIGMSAFGSFFSENIRGDTLFVGFRNYSEIFNDDSFWNTLKVTLIFNLIINPFQIFCAMALALMVQRPTRFIELFRMAFIMPMTVSIALTSIIWSILLDPTLGPVNGALRAFGFQGQSFFRSESQALPTLIMVATWKGAGYWMIFLLAGLLAIPKEIHDAALVDGAVGLKKFIYITLPLMKRPLAFVLVADTAANFLLFAPIYIITNGGPNGSTQLLMFEAYQAAFAYLNHGRSMAISTVILVIVLVMAALELRFFKTPEEAVK